MIPPAQHRLAGRRSPRTGPRRPRERVGSELRIHQALGNSWAILFSHPADFTPVCTTELGEFARRKKEFDDRNTKIIGISVDSVDSHRGWSADIGETQGHDLNFPHIGDEDRTVAHLYGMIHPKAHGAATVRTVFVIGPDKKVKLTLTYPAAIGRNVDELVRVLDALQLSAEHAVSTPVNWNDGDDVVISPAISDDEAAIRSSRGSPPSSPTCASHRNRTAEQCSRRRLAEGTLGTGGRRTARQP